jgi:hypothetical protein
MDDATDQRVDIATLWRPERCGHVSMLTPPLRLFGDLF